MSTFYHLIIVNFYAAERIDSRIQRDECIFKNELYHIHMDYSALYSSTLYRETEYNRKTDSCFFLLTNTADTYLT